MAQQSPENPAPDPVSPVFIPEDWNLTEPIITTTTTTNPGIIGQVIILPTTTLPSADWLWCDGTSYSTTTYATLFDIIGYTYGGSGASFSVPNLLAKTPIGADTTAILQTLYQGANTISSGNRVMTANQLPSHNHGYSHTHDFTYTWNYQNTTVSNASGITGGATPFVKTVTTGTANGTGNGTTTTPNGGNTTANAGLGAEFLAPFIVVNFCIRWR
jgi:microcystin-dependent protein